MRMIAVPSLSVAAGVSAARSYCNAKSSRVAMRVIAGSAGGVRLAVPKRGVRPTMDRVKAAIFSSLGDAIIGARVLDLFAGSGALGIEALSRGAASAIFVEDDRQSAEAIEKNLAKTKLKGRVRHQDVFDFLRHTIERGRDFKSFLRIRLMKKPTRDESHTEKLLNNESLPQLLEPNGIFVLEKRPSRDSPCTRSFGAFFGRKLTAQQKCCF